MEQYNVTGMSCAACSARVEKAVNAVPGVKSCSVSLLTNSMGVEGSASADDIIKAVENAGYGASVKGAGTASEHRAGELEDRETPLLKKRLAASLCILLPLMYISMGHNMFGAPLPPFLDGNCAAVGITELLLCGIIMVINRKFFINGAKGIMHGAPNMDTLVAMGSGVSFVWSVFMLFGMTAALQAGDTERAMSGLHGLWFESAAMILTLITVGKTLEAHSKGRTTDALRGLMELAPETARVERDGAEQTIPAGQVRIGDIFVVRQGEHIPVDGVVISGNSAVDESALTGESIPADKTEGSFVSAGTVNTSGFLRCKAERVGTDTAIARIIKLVSDASATKAPIARIADKVSGVFVPTVIGIAVITLTIWLLVGQTFEYALERAVSVLVISCPCALGLATPVAVMVGSGVGARNGILFKTAASLEATGKVQIAVLDKTGTVTSGTPSVTDIIPVGEDSDALLKTAYSLERSSNHPLAGAVIRYAQEKGIISDELTGFEAVTGSGLTALCGEERLYGGNAVFISDKAVIPEELTEAAARLSDEGKTPLFFSRGGKLLGIIAAADTIKTDSAAAVKQLRALGIRPVMLTGDNKKTAAAIGGQAGIDDVIAGVFPDGKEAVVRGAQKFGSVAMIGDGINDAPALTRADIGIAVGAGTDVAIDAADVVLMKNSLADAAAAVRLSRAVLRNIKQNLFWAFIYNVIGIPLAAGAFTAAFGLELDPMFGAAAMSLSSFCVVTNALRLNLFRLHDTSRDRPRRDRLDTPIDIESLLPRDMTVTLNVKGMMCPHCEATVRKCIMQFPEVSSADVSHEKGTAVLHLNAPLTHLEEMKQAITDKGYEVL